MIRGLYILTVVFIVLGLVIGGVQYLQSNFQDPHFSPSKDWSVQYIDLFKRAIREQYALTDEHLKKHLFLVGIANNIESETEGFAATANENKVNISYIYRIDWVYFSEVGSGFNFASKDASGNPLSDTQILADIKNKIPIFGVRSVIPESKARAICGTPWYAPLSPMLRPYSYNQPSNYHWDDRREDLVLECTKIENMQENRCARTFLSLTTGKILLRQETACYTTPARSNLI